MNKCIDISAIIESIEKEPSEHVEKLKELKEFLNNNCYRKILIHSVGARYHPIGPSGNPLPVTVPFDRDEIKVIIRPNPRNNLNLLNFEVMVEELSRDFTALVNLTNTPFDFFD